MRLDVDFADAQARLGGLARGSFLRHASGAAYREGVAGVAGAALAGSAPGLPGLPGLANVRCLGPVVHDFFIYLPVRWEVAGRTGSPFPALDADIVLLPHCAGGTLLEVSGVYRQPQGTLGAELDRGALHGVAEVTVQAFTRYVGVAIVSGAVSR